MTFSTRNFATSQSRSTNPDDLANEPKSARAASGHFTDLANTLLPVFNDSDGRGSRRRREIVGLDRQLPRTHRGAIYRVRSFAIVVWFEINSTSVTQ